MNQLTGENIMPTLFEKEMAYANNSIENAKSFKGKTKILVLKQKTSMRVVSKLLADGYTIKQIKGPEGSTDRAFVVSWIYGW